jgi:protein TonB
LDPAAAPLLPGEPRFRRPPAPPVYPARAQERGEEGTVALRLLVGGDGATLEIRLHRSSGNRLLDEAALAAARRWEVEPPVVGGRRAAAWVEVPVRFRLER